MENKPIRYAECKECGRIASTTQQTRNIRCSCKGYMTEITKNKYDDFQKKKSKPASSEPEKPDESDEMDSEESDIPEEKEDSDDFKLEIDERDDESNFEELEFEGSETPKTADKASGDVTVVGSTTSNGKSSLGALLVIGENALFRLKGKDVLTDDEIKAIKEKAEPVAEKHPELASQLGPEIELIEASTTPIFKRFELKSLLKGPNQQPELPNGP